MFYLFKTKHSHKVAAFSTAPGPRPSSPLQNGVPRVLLFKSIVNNIPQDCWGSLHGQVLKESLLRFGANECMLCKKKEWNPDLLGGNVESWAPFFCTWSLLCSKRRCLTVQGQVFHGCWHCWQEGQSILLCQGCRLGPQHPQRLACTVGRRVPGFCWDFTRGIGYRGRLLASVPVSPLSGLYELEPQFLRL